MSFLRLEISQFRNLASAKIDPIPQGINLFYGENGSGKTSLLEAIYYLNLGRSFRNTKNDRIINKEAEKFSIFAQIMTSMGQKTPIGIEREQDGAVKMRIAGKDVRSIAELADLLPVLLITSHCHHFLDSSPILRRNYLDWGAFYSSNDFFRVWRWFTRSLKQRNAALRDQLPKKEREIWDKELIESALQLDQFRQDYVAQLLPLLLDTVSELISIPDLQIKYLRGWNQDINYADSLLHSLERDQQVGYTQMGPHRADLKVTIRGVPAKDILSRGQQKLFICAMILAQGSLLHRSAEKKPIYLIDDLPAELDLISRKRLMELLFKQKTQVFVTAVEREILESFLNEPSTKMFHVEHGEITEMAPKGVLTVE